MNFKGWRMTRSFLFCKILNLLENVMLFHNKFLRGNFGIYFLHSKCCKSLLRLCVKQFLGQRN